MIRIKYPEKITMCNPILEKSTIGLLDIIQLNTFITGKENEEKSRDNQKLKSYDKSTILQILDYQKKHKMNNTHLARHFKLSRNTVTKWKKIYI